MRRVYIILSAVISAVFVLLGVFVFRTSYLRLWEAIKDMGVSFAYYFCVLFRIKNSLTLGVTEYSKVMEWNMILPEDFFGFQTAVNQYIGLLFNGKNFQGWLTQTGEVMSGLSQALTILLPCGAIGYLILRRLYQRENFNHNVDTLPLWIYKKIEGILYYPLRRFVIGYRTFLREHDNLWKAWIATWVLHLNLASIVFAFLAYYFYFSVSYDFGTIYVQIAKLAIDLQVILQNFPWWVLLITAYYFFDRWRKQIAKGRLRHYEARNCGFIKELPIVSITCGSMGKKKTTAIADMMLSQEVMFRQQALKILQRADLKFPHFPWIRFEDELRACMAHHTVYHLASTKTWVALKRGRFENHHDYGRQLYGYDGEKYGMEYNDGLSVQYLFDVLETYAQAYFVYVITSSLIVSNFSVRSDNQIQDIGNFPIWCLDFFPEGITEGRHAHILDFDVLRLGRKLIEDNPKIGSFEFGVVGITEIGKERGNNLELKEVKKGAEETNQKNDLFNAWLKMCRHSATIDNFPFIKVFTDEQRPESWGADARDLAEILHIISSGEQRHALPFYEIEEMISEFMVGSFLRFYTDMRYRRGDNTLLVYLWKKLTVWLWKRTELVYNKYGYCILKIEKERGTMTGRRERKKYFLMNAKIYACRFSTDCFSDYFNDLASRTNVGLNDYMEYRTEKASIDELRAQNSYFINGLYGDERR